MNLYMLIKKKEIDLQNKRSDICIMQYFEVLLNTTLKTIKFIHCWLKILINKRNTHYIFSDFCEKWLYQKREISSFYIIDFFLCRICSYLHLYQFLSLPDYNSLMNYLSYIRIDGEQFNILMVILLVN